MPVGKDEADNEVLSTWGSLPSFEFEPQAHWDLAPALDIIDFERGARLGGSGFVVYKGVGARLVARSSLSSLMSSPANKAIPN